MKYILLFLIPFLCLGQSPKIEIVIDGRPYDLSGGITYVQNPEAKINHIDLSGEHHIDSLKGNPFYSTSNAKVYLPEKTAHMDGRVLSFANAKGESSIIIPGYWAVMDSIGYVKHRGATIKNRQLISFLVKADTLLAYSGAFTPYNEKTPEIDPGDFILKESGAGLEFTRKNNRGIAVAKIPVPDISPGNKYDVSLNFDKFLSKDINVQLGPEWDALRTISDQGNIVFKGVTPKVANAPIILYSTATIISGARIKNLKSTKVN